MTFEARYDDKSVALQLLDMATMTSKIIFKTEPNAGNAALMPVFAPDGRTIAFTSKVDGNSEVCTIRNDGSNFTNLTRNRSADSAPAFSADGRELFFQSNREGSFERFHLYRMNADGSAQRRVTGKDGYEFSPSLLPDGKSLVFSGDRLDETSRALDIRRVALDGTGQETVLVSRRFHDTQPAASPDGSRIAFVAQSDGNSEIYLMNADGSGLVRLTRNAADDINPKFSADGGSIFFSSNRGGRYAIYQLSLTGSFEPVNNS
jgi:TolB protein